MADRTNRVGQDIGDYHLLRWLGGGGFGDVYLGEHIRTQAQVAVKVLQTRLTRSDELKEFINEARTFRLKHPHIVPLLDFGINSDDVPYLVMEYASHGTLRDTHPKGRQVPLSTILSYVAPLASALQYAHDQHLIHRDVKPENMLLDAHKNVLLTDFGIAAVAHSSRSLNTQEDIGGTLPYMAPEQIQGKARPASDQYALGIVVYEWLTGTRPFKGTAVEIALQQSMTPPPSLREQVPTLSADVEQVVLTALAKDPKRRFASVTAFATALEQASQKRETFHRVEPPPPSLHIPPLSAVATPMLPREPVEGVIPLNPEQISANVPFHPVPSAPAPSLHTHKITEAVSQARSLSSTPPPLPMPSPYKKRSIQSRALFLVGLTVLIIIGSIGLATVTTQIATQNAHATATAQSIAGKTATVSAIPTVAAVAYDRAVATNGIMFGFDAQHTRYNPFERILNPTTILGLKTAWTSDHTGNSITSSPAVANGVVYVESHDRKLYVYNAEGCSSNYSCPPLWTSDPTSTATDNYIDSSPAVANGVVYVGSHDDKLYAYKAEGCGSGKSTCPPLWTSDPTGSYIESSPAVANGVVYVGSDDDKLYAYKAEGCGSGKSTCPPLWTSDPTGSYITSSPAVANGVVYVESHDHRLYAYKAEGCSSGKSTCPPLWTSDPTSTATDNVIDPSPAVANGVVYVGSFDGKLYAYKAEGCSSGKSTCPPLWTSNPTGNPIISSPAVANGVVYVGSLDYKLYAYKAEGCGSGKSTCPPLWTSDPTGRSINSSPAVANGVVYVGSDDGKLYAFHV